MTFRSPPRSDIRAADPKRPGGSRPIIAVQESYRAARKPPFIQNVRRYWALLRLQRKASECVAIGENFMIVFEALIAGLLISSTAWAQPDISYDASYTHSQNPEEEVTCLRRKSTLIVECHRLREWRVLAKHLRPSVLQTQDKAREIIEVCRTGATTGSRVVRSVCRTTQEWALVDQSNARTPLQGMPAFYP